LGETASYNDAGLEGNIPGSCNCDILQRSGAANDSFDNQILAPGVYSGRASCGIAVNGLIECYSNRIKRMVAEQRDRIIVNLAAYRCDGASIQLKRSG
jgi:hypothetical protein